MTYRTALFVAVLIFVLGLGAGFAFDRWLHRPIDAGGFHVSLVSTGAPAPSPASPIPPCLISCVPDDQHGDGIVEPEEDTQAICYGDGSIPCPGQAPRVRAYGDCKRDDVICSPQERECWWAMGGDYCQKET